MHCPYCRNTDTRVLDSPGRRRRRRDPPPALLPRAASKRFTHRRADAADGAQALRRDRAVHPREGDRRRPQGLQGPPGLRGRPGLPRPGGRGRAARRAAGPRSRPTRSGWRSSARCASSTRSPTCGSRASTAPSSPPTTSRPRSRCCAPSARRRSPPGEPSPPASTVSPPRADHRLPGASWGSCVPGTPTQPHQRHAAPARRSRPIQQRRHRGNEEHGMTETVSGGSARQRARKRQGPEDRAGLQHRGRAPLRRAHLGASRRRPDRTGRPARPSSSSAASSSPTSGRSTPPPSSPRSTSAAPSAPTSASGASSSSSTGS